MSISVTKLYMAKKVLVAQVRQVADMEISIQPLYTTYNNTH